MHTELIQLSFDKIMQTKSYTMILLTALDRRFAIYTEPNVGRILQLYLTGMAKPRPLTHDLLQNVLKADHLNVLQVVINDLEETTYFARLFLEKVEDGIQHIIEIDARPSDSITLALMNNAPVYCTREVLAKTVPVTND